MRHYGTPMQPIIFSNPQGVPMEHRKKESLMLSEAHPPAQFTANLRRMVLDSVHHQITTGILSIYLDDLLWSLNDFFDLLDEAAKEFPARQ